MVEALEDYVERNSGGTPKYKVLEDLYYKVKSGEYVLRDPHPPRTFIEYLSRPAYNLWLYTSIILSILALVSIYLTRIAPWIEPVRYVFGAIYVLFIPGYSLIEALYPEEGRLSDLERFALSLGLSLALVPLIGLLLNYTPWGIRLNPYIVVSLLLIIALLFTGAYRKYRLMVERMGLQARIA